MLWEREQSQEKIGAIKNVQAKSVVTGTAGVQITARWPQCKSFSRPVKKKMKQHCNKLAGTALP